MKEKHRNTLVMLVLAVGIVLVSSLGKDVLLQQTERRVLNQQGELAVEPPVVGLQGTTEAEGNSAETMGIDKKLTVEQAREALDNWMNRKYEMIHDPVEGQLSMEEAAKSAIDWLTIMENELQLEKREKSIYSVSAILYVGVQEQNRKEQYQAYHSFWTVQLVGKDLTATLLLNAVSGEVWKAEVALPIRNMEDHLLHLLYTFAELTGLWEEEEKEEILLAKDCAIIRGTHGAVARLQCTELQQAGVSLFEYEEILENIDVTEYMKMQYSIEFEEE